MDLHSQTVVSVEVGMGKGATALRQMRIIHAVFLAATLLQIYNSEWLARNDAGVPNSFLAGIVFAALFELLIAYYIRRKTMFPALEKLRRDPNDMEALRQWRKSIILILVLTMSVALYGLVLRVSGLSREVSWPFFALGLILLWLWRPQLDLSGGVPTAESPL